MKKAIIISLAIAVAFTMSGVTVMATDAGDQYNSLGIPTQFEISNSGTGNDPVVLVKWEEEKTVSSLESGDNSHLTGGTQIYPPLEKDIDKMITICSVVKDQQGLNTIMTVKAWVDAPNIDKYCGDTEMGVYPLAKEYDPTSGMADAMARFQTAVDYGLTTYNSGTTYQDIWNGINNGGVQIYCGDFPLNYEDPAGTYSIDVKAQDSSNRWGFLQNDLDYIAVAGFEVDFSTIDYGIVTLGNESQVLGNGGNGQADPYDTAFNYSDGMPTVRGIGNKRLNLTVSQDLMELPHIGDVSYAARMGNTEATKVPYDPEQTVELPDVLELSGISKLDFWITVTETDPDNATNIYNGNMTLGCTPADFDPCMP